MNPQSFTLRVNDQSGAWIDVNIDRNDGVRSTGHINNNDSGGFTESLQLYRNHKNRLTRWRPGFLNVPVNGGGDLWFEVPKSAVNVFMQITVKG